MRTQHAEDDNRRMNEPSTESQPTGDVLRSHDGAST